jgi:hypothetical protein
MEKRKIMRTKQNSRFAMLSFQVLVSTVSTSSFWIGGEGVVLHIIFRRGSMRNDRESVDKGIYIQFQMLWLEFCLIFRKEEKLQDTRYSNLKL